MCGSAWLQNTRLRDFGKVEFFFLKSGLKNYARLIKQRRKCLL